MKTFIQKVADLKLWSEMEEEPSDGLEDSHECLMDLINEARLILKEQGQ